MDNGDQLHAAVPDALGSKDWLHVDAPDAPDNGDRLHADIPDAFGNGGRFQDSVSYALRNGATTQMLLVMVVLAYVQEQLVMLLQRLETMLRALESVRWSDGGLQAARSARDLGIPMRDM